MNALPFTCRCCGLQVIPQSALVRARLEERGLCQGCRAAETLRDRPWLLSEFVGFWKENGFPASDSWLHALPAARDVDPAPWSRSLALRGDRFEDAS